MTVKAITYPTRTQSTPILQEVSYRTLWADEWTVTTAMWCEQVCWATAPGISQASFRHRYGSALHWATGSWASVAKLTLPPRSYVRVRVQGHNFSTPSTLYRDWVGIWRSCVDRTGEQIYVADGIEALLSFHTIRNSWYVDHAFTLLQAHSGLEFNSDGKPNRSPVTVSVNGISTYVFDDRADVADWWSTRDIVEYLLATQVPLRADDSPLFTWQLVNPTALSNWDRPTIKSHGRTTLELLHDLIDRRRLTSFYCRIKDLETDPDVAEIVAFTLTDADIVIEDAMAEEWGTIPANANQVALTFTDSPDVSRSLSVEANHVADRVRVLGPKRQSVFSVSIQDASLAIGWTTTDRAAYEASGRDLPAYPDEFHQHAREVFDRMIRNSDVLADVYARYVIPDDWVQLVKNGEGEGTGLAIAIEGDVEITGQHLIPAQDWDFARELPLLSGYNYSGTVLWDAEILNTLGHRGEEIGEAPFVNLLPFVVLQRPDDDTKWVFVDQIGTWAPTEVVYIDESGVTDLPANWDWSASMRLFDQDDGSGRDRGFQLHITGADRHIIAAQDYNAFSVAAALRTLDDQYRGAWRYDRMIATVCIEEGRRMEAVYPETPTPVGEFINEIVVDVGEGDYRLIYVAPQTIVGIDDETGQLQRCETGAYLQDDRPYLQILARRLYEWYSVARYVLSLSTRYLHCDLWLGSYVEQFTDEYGASAVESVVSEIVISFPVGINGPAQTPSVQYQTQFGELDVGALL